MKRYILILLITFLSFGCTDQTAKFSGSVINVTNEQARSSRNESEHEIQVLLLSDKNTKISLHTDLSDTLFISSPINYCKRSFKLASRSSTVNEFNISPDNPIKWVIPVKLSQNSEDEIVVDLSNLGKVCVPATLKTVTLYFMMYKPLEGKSGFDDFKLPIGSVQISLHN